MKTNVVQKAGRKIETIIFEYEDNKEVKVLLQEPNFEETCEAYKYIYDENGKIDMITPGKLIFDLCAIEISDNLFNNHRLMMSVCTNLTTSYTLPIQSEIKKKD